MSSTRSSVPPSTPSRSLLVERVSVELFNKGLTQELHKRYPTLERVTTLEYRSQEKDKDNFINLQLDFKSDVTIKQLLEKNFFLLAEKRHTIRVFRSLICHRCQEQGHRAIECPQKPITEERLRQLCDEQQRQLGEMLAKFDQKWNERLATVQNGSKTNEQVSGICNDLVNVSQQFHQQNTLMQKQFSLLLNQMQQLQMKSTIINTNGH